MEYVSWTITRAMSNSSIADVLGVSSVSTPNGYLAWVVNFVDGWYDGIIDMFSVDNILVIVLFVILILSLFSFKDTK